MNSGISWSAGPISKAKSFFPRHVPPQHKAAFRRTMYVKNMTRISRIACFTLIFEVLLLVFLFAFRSFKLPEDHTTPFTMLSIFTVAVALIALVATVQLKKMPIPAPWTGQGIWTLFFVLSYA